MCAIIGAGFHLDRVLSNGLLPLDMASTVKDVDSVLVVMLSSLVDAPSFSKEKDGFLHSLLDKHPITILAFLTKNQHVHVSRNKDGKSAFEVYSGKNVYKICIKVLFNLISGVEDNFYSMFLCILTKQRTCFMHQHVCARIHQTQVNFVH